MEVCYNLDLGLFYIYIYEYLPAYMYVHHKCTHLVPVMVRRG